MKINFTLYLIFIRSLQAYAFIVGFFYWFRPEVIVLSEIIEKRDPILLISLIIVTLIVEIVLRMRIVSVLYRGEVVRYIGCGIFKLKDSYLRLGFFKVINKKEACDCVIDFYLLSQKKLSLRKSPCNPKVTSKKP